MRRTLFAVLAALLPAAASAAPFATYNPANGDVSFHEVLNGKRIQLLARTNRINPALPDVPVQVTPADAALPRFESFSTFGATWAPVTPQRTFLFHTFSVRAAIVPYTPIDDLRFMFHGFSDVWYKQVPVYLVPEPSTLALALCGLLAFRRRK